MTLLSGPEIVHPEAVGLSSSRLGRLEAVVQRYIDRRQLAGAITVIMRRGQVAHYGLYGQMDQARGLPMQADALFRIFSMTKPVTSLAALMLYEEGAFHLQHPVSVFIPAFYNLKVFVRQTETGIETAPLARLITIHDLLTHTSGLGYGLDMSNPVEALYQEADLLDPRRSMAEKIERMVEIPLHHQPGSCYTYSMATDVLGYLVELLSGLRLDEFFRQRIFEPLGMFETNFSVPPDKLARLAALYTTHPNEGLMDVADYPGNPAQFPFGLWTDKSVQPAFLSGGAGLVSTAGDYLRFLKMLRGQGELEGVRLISRKTFELMTSAHLRPEQFFLPGFSYGLGVTILTDPAAAQTLGSPGAYGGGGAAHTSFWIDPHEDMVGLLMTQYIHTTPLMLSEDFRLLAAQAVAD